MKTATTKVTHSLDTLTVLEVEELAASWDVPKSEVIRRSVHAAAAQPDAVGGRPMTAEEALACLQREPRLSPAQAKAWARRVREERQHRDRP